MVDNMNQFACMIIRKVTEVPLFIYESITLDRNELTSKGLRLLARRESVLRVPLPFCLTPPHFGYGFFSHEYQTTPYYVGPQ